MRSNKYAAPLLGALVATSALAQAGRPAPVDIPTSPQSLPGDYFDLPQGAQLTVPLGPPAGPNPTPAAAPPSAVPSPGMALAAEAAEAAAASCAADGYTIAVAVTDSAGNLKAALGPDGVRPNGVYMALHKAVTVVTFKMSTLEFRTRVEKDPALMAQVAPAMALLPGGIPIFKRDQLIGAIATSGAAAYEEEKCARDGIAKIRSRL